MSAEPGARDHDPADVICPAAPESHLGGVTPPVGCASTGIGEQRDRPRPGRVEPCPGNQPVPSVGGDGVRPLPRAALDVVGRDGGQLLGDRCRPRRQIGRVELGGRDTGPHGAGGEVRDVDNRVERVRVDVPFEQRPDRVVCAVAGAVRGRQASRAVTPSTPRVSTSTQRRAAASATGRRWRRGRPGAHGRS